MKIALVIKLHKICYQYIKKHRKKYIHCKNPTYSQPCTSPKNIVITHEPQKGPNTLTMMDGQITVLFRKIPRNNLFSFVREKHEQTQTEMQAEVDGSEAFC